MTRPLRSEVFDPECIGVYHCYNRVVRRAFLCGYDPVTGTDYSYRKDWFENRLRYLSQHFCLEIQSFAILSNHFHVVLRNRPDLVAKLTDRQVVERWLMICPRSVRQADGTATNPKEKEILFELNRPGRVADLCARLSNPSWLIRLLCQYMGRRCNIEDGQTGKFFELRYRMTRLLDEPAVLACMAYVDLNPIRAGLSETLEGYEHVSIAQRLRHAKGGPENEAAWLAPVELRAETDGNLVSVVNHLSPQQVQHETEKRDSERLGCLPMRLEEYVLLLSWLIASEQQKSSDEPLLRGQDVLERQGIEPQGFERVVLSFPACFSTAAGCSASLDREAQRRGRRPLRGYSRSALQWISHE